MLRGGWQATRRSAVAYRLLPILLFAAALLLARAAPVAPLAVAAALAALVIPGLLITHLLMPSLTLVERVSAGTLISVCIVAAVAVPALLISPPVTAVLAVIFVALSVPPLLWALRPPAPRPEPLGLATAGPALVMVAALASSLATAIAGPYVPSGSDGPFHVATLRRLLTAPTWRPPDGYFFDAAGPVPQYGTDPWYAVLGLLSATTGLQPFDTLRYASPGLAFLAVVGVAALVMSGLARAGVGPRWVTAGGVVAVGLALILDGAGQAAFPWRQLSLPRDAATMILVPGALVLLWNTRGQGLLGPALLGIAGLVVGLVHLEAGALLGVVGLGEMVATALAALRRWRLGQARARGPRARRRTDLTRLVPVIGLLLGLAAAVAVQLPALTGVAAAAGARDYGNPVFARQLSEVGPWIIVRPTRVFAGLAPLALLGALITLALGARRPGIRALAAGALIAPALVLVPPVATAIAEITTSLYLRRLGSLTGEPVIPLAAAASVLSIRWILARVRVPASLVSRRAGWTTVLPVALIAVGALMAVGTVCWARLADHRSLPAWTHRSARQQLAVEQDGRWVEAAVRPIRARLPAQSVVLADAATSYLLPALLDVWVVAVPPTHSISQDFRRISIRGHTVAGDDARRFLLEPLSVDEQRAILDRYGVTHVVLSGARLDVDPRAFLRSHRETLRLVARARGPIAIYEVVRDGTAGTLIASAGTASATRPAARHRSGARAGD